MHRKGCIPAPFQLLRATSGTPLFLAKLTDDACSLCLPSSRWSFRPADDVIQLLMLQREYLASYSLRMCRLSNSHMADLMLSNIGNRRSTDLGRVVIANQVAMRDVWERCNATLLNNAAPYAKATADILLMHESL